MSRAASADPTTCERRSPDMRRALLPVLTAAALGIAACSDAAPPSEVAPTPAAPEATTAPGGEADKPPAPPPLDFGGGAPSGPRPRTIYGVDAMNRLVVFPAKTPASTTAAAITGLASGETVLGIDFRPSDGQLYALGSTSRIYIVDTTTRAARAVSPMPFAPGLQGQSFGFDFNPVADAIRIHSDFDQNLRVSPMTGGILGTDKALVFAASDPNVGQSPNVVASAYTNSVSPKPQATALFAIDSTRDLLVKVAPPNDGVVTSVGSLGVDATAASGFDIWGDATPEAYAALVVGGATQLYTIDLTTGAATLVAPIMHDAPLASIAVAP